MPEGICEEVLVSFLCFGSIFIRNVFGRKICNGTVVDAYIDILVIIAEALSENGKTADMFGIFLHFQF